MAKWRGPTNARGLPVHAASDHTNGTTGSGAVVLATSPTIVTPTIADFTNANHDHEDTDDGGLLDTFAVQRAKVLGSYDQAFWEARTESTSYANGDAVGTITDSSAAASNWTAAGGARATWYSTGGSSSTLPNGFPFIRFNGSSNYYSRAARIGANAMTCVAVLRNSGGGTGYRIFVTMDNHLLIKSGGSNQWGFYSGADILYGAALSSSWNIVVWRVNGTGYNSWDMSAQGLMLNATTAGASQAKTVALMGENSGGAGQWFDADVAAFAIASSALSDLIVALTVSYFKSVYCP